MPAASTILELNLGLCSRIPRPDPDVFAPIHDVIGCPKIFDSEFASHDASLLFWLFLSIYKYAVLRDPFTVLRDPFTTPLRARLNGVEARRTALMRWR